MTGLKALVRRPLGKARHWALQAFFGLLERVVPVRDDYWCFCTWSNYPHTIDNPRSVFEHVKDDPSIRKVILQKRPSAEVVDDGANVTFVPAESFRGAYLLARSRVVLLGYALRGLSSYARRASNRHLIVQLWHGIPIRKIGRLFPRENWWASETPLYSAMVASSQRERENLTRAFAPLTAERIWVTGLPRNDFILEPEEELPTDYREYLQQIRQLARGRRLVLYAPTWRDTEEGHFEFSTEQRKRLAAFLKANNAVLGIRTHPNVRHLSLGANQPGADEVLALNDFPVQETDILAIEPWGAKDDDVQAKTPPSRSWPGPRSRSTTRATTTYTATKCERPSVLQQKAGPIAEVLLRLYPRAMLR